MTTTEVSGRVKGRSVLEPFSARRPSQGLKVGPNRVPTAPQEVRKAPRGANTRLQGPGHGVDVPDGVREDRPGPGTGDRPVTTTTKGRCAGEVSHARDTRT